MKSAYIVVPLIVALSAVCIASEGQTYTVSPILAPPGWTDVRFQRLNNLGQVVGFGINGSDQQAFIGTTSGSIPIPMLVGCSWTQAFGINDLGQVVGYCSNGPFIGTTSGITVLPEPTGWYWTSLYGINNSGQLVGTAVIEPTWRAFTGTIAGLVAIPLPDGFLSNEAWNINDLGQVVGYGQKWNGSSMYWQVFIGTESSSLPVPMPAGWSQTWPGGINNQGIVAGYGLVGPSGNRHYESFFGTSSEVTVIPRPLGWEHMQTGSFSAINNQGQIVGRGGPLGAFMGWIWDPDNGTRILNDVVSVEWTIQEARSINNAGQILALASNQNTGYEGLVLLDLITPQQQTEDLISKVVALMAGGVLSTGQGNSLIVKLQNAIEQMNGGNAKTAVNQLGAFITEVSALIRSRILSPAQGQPLIDAANAIIAKLGQ